MSGIISPRKRSANSSTVSFDPPISVSIPCPIVTAGAEARRDWLAAETVLAPRGSRSGFGARLSFESYRCLKIIWRSLVFSGVAMLSLAGTLFFGLVALGRRIVFRQVYDVGG